MNIKQALLGKPLPTHELAHQAISKPVGLAVFASDALSSTAYATQEILVILAIAAGTSWAGEGGSTFGLSIPIAIAISVLLVIVTLSYRQTIYAYPNGGGAYIVARDNLGETPAQVAGAALMTDYILTVAVSISAGVAQITSAFPELFDYRVILAIGFIGFITVMNLRGVKESGRIFAVPTYAFLFFTFLMLAVGLFRYATGDLPKLDHDAKHVEVVHNAGTASLGIFLLLRAFSSGCTALTGIEAISNGITAFKDPKSHNAAITLIWMSSILIVLFIGITILGNYTHVLPSEEETVISQLARTVYDESSPLYFLTLAGTTLILLMAANTSYADFPRLAALHAGDGFLPRQLTHRGGRLVFSWGIVFLASAASLLVAVTGASVTSLIPLYAVGVFLSFTVSQTGMVVRYQKISKLKPGEKLKGLETDLEYEPSWRTHQIISAVGAVCTGIVMIVFAVTKFTAGAWFIVILIPTLVFIFFRIHHHYKAVAHKLSLRQAVLDTEPRKVKTLVLVADVHAETIRMVNFAKSLGHDWEGIHIATSPEKAQKAKEKWMAQVGQDNLVMIESPYRQLAGPVKEYIKKLHDENPDMFIHIIMGQLVMDSFWEQALHQNSVVIFNIALSQIDNVAVTVVPYQIRTTGDERDFHPPAPQQEPQAFYGGGAKGA